MTQQSIPMLQVDDPDLIRILILNAKKEGSVPWVNGEEAAVLLGIPINNNLPRKLQWLLHQGLVERHTRSGKSTMYWREEIERLAPKLADGELQIPTKF